MSDPAGSDGDAAPGTDGETGPVGVGETGLDAGGEAAPSTAGEPDGCWGVDTGGPPHPTAPSTTATTTPAISRDRMLIVLPSTVAPRRYRPVKQLLQR
jgi:hypothetical protein